MILVMCTWVVTSILAMLVWAAATPYHWLAIGLALLCAPVHAELPCVSPADAMLVVTSQADAALAVFGLEASAGIARIRCSPGKRVGLWIASAEPVWVEPATIIGCEVGVVVDTRQQALEDFSILGARVGVCWQQGDGYMEGVHIEASEVALAMKEKPVWVIRSTFHAPSVVIYDAAGGCTCAGAV